MSPPRKKKRAAGSRQAPAAKTSRRTRAAPARHPAPARRVTGGSAARRADFGAPIDGFVARQPAHLRAILVELRRLVEAAAPDAAASMKWGIPFFSIGDEMMCGLGAHRDHVNLILPGRTGTYADPGGRLEGASPNGRHLKLRSVEDLPRGAVRGWIRTAAARARAAGRAG